MRIVRLVNNLLGLSWAKVITISSHRLDREAGILWIGQAQQRMSPRYLYV